MVYTNPAKPNPLHVMQYCFKRMIPTIYYRKPYPAGRMPVYAQYSQLIFFGALFAGVVVVRKMAYGFTNENTSLENRKYYTLPRTYTNFLYKSFARGDLKKNQEEQKFVF
ncbi:unnamed protein product [Moneuplotes crassus]|uniref:Uncharacterized protein n=2 Tax=Euplotes crassus TaxID=5936 RepID=A0AAD2DAV1_EUPCR|nr:unnamed protein product [Moneuplotes crassus]